MGRYYSTKETAKILGLTQQDVVRRIRAGQINANRIGWVYAISEAAVNKAKASKWYERLMELRNS